MGETIRAFIAAEISPETRGKIGDLISRLKKHEGIRWVRPESIHITLRFLGNITSEQVDLIHEAMEEAVKDTSPVSVEVSGWGSFPPEKRPRVFWLGLGKGGPELSGFFEKLEKELVKRGLGEADKAFSPHLTIGRVKSPKALSKVTKSLEHKASGSFGEFTVERVVLFQSKLLPEGALYTALRESNFSG